ncbi:MAG TPA: hypothetical protein PLN39_01765 [Candidatus Dojkabacteria bacterium]|nr:hypothetical protein [Candidatus Dojkabacteria bacterium]
MSSIKKIYRIIEKIREITSRKSFSRVLFAFLTVFSFFLTFNAFAQDDENVISPDWEGEKKFHNIVNKVDNESEDNSATGLGQQNVTSLWTWTVYLGGSDILDEETREKLEASNVPIDLKRGLIGMADGVATTVYANYPMVDIPGHLAQQWVPGYKDSTTALYAQNIDPSDITNGYMELSASGITPLWTRTLNIAYVFFVIVMIIGGFMIMFRHKLGGQTMVTLGNVLPKVIVSLIVATFSFAIAGIIIDFGGLLISIIVNILGITDANPISNLGPIMGSVFRGGLGTTAGIVGSLGSLLGLGTILKAGGIAALTGFGPFFLAGLGGVGLLFALVVLVIIFVGAVNVVLTLLKAYLQLLISVIIGPLQITFGALPGGSSAIKNWVTSILKNVLVFPVVFFIINLPNALQAGGDINLRLPAKLVYEDPSTYDPNGIGVAGGLFLGILKIFVLFFAAQAPKFIEGIFPANSNKGLAGGFEAAKASMSKVPLVGGLFGK